VVALRLAALASLGLAPFGQSSQGKRDLRPEASGLRQGLRYAPKMDTPWPGVATAWPGHPREGPDPGLGQSQGLQAGGFLWYTGGSVFNAS